MTPTAVTIVGGSSDGETALLEVEGEMQGAPGRGRITLVRMQGLWVAREADWR
jgi:hypothetical protein